MYQLHYYNVTWIINHTSYWRYFQIFLRLELLFYMIDIFFCCCIIYLIIKTKPFHFNFSTLIVFVYAAHMVDNTVNIMMRFMMLNSSINDYNIKDDYLYVVLIFTSVMSIMTEFCTFPLLVLERCFATYFVSDYEINRRRYISLLLCLCQLLYGTISAIITFNDESLTIYVFMVLTYINVTAIVLMFFLYEKGKCQLNRSQLNLSPNTLNTKTLSYSLSRRYQISENIRVLMLLRMLFIYMGIMNPLTIALALLTSFHYGPVVQICVTGSLSIIIFIYSSQLMVIIILRNEKMMLLVRNIFDRIGCLNLKVNYITPLRNSFGANMRYNNEQETYFNQLEVAWNVRSKNENK